MGRRAQGWRLREGDTGIWYVRFTHTKTRHELSTGERDRGLAATRAAEIYAHIVSQRPEPKRKAPRSPLHDLVGDWIVSLDATHSPATVQLFATHMRAHLVPWFRSLDRVTTGRIADYQRERLKHVERATVRKERNTLVGFLAWCVEQDVCSPVMVPKLPRGAAGVRASTRVRRAVSVTPEQVERFLVALPEYSGGTRGARAVFPVRDRFIVAWETGLRPRTIDSLTSAHFTPGRHELRITKDIDKTKNARTVRISQRAHDALARHVGEGPIFGAHDRRTYVAAAAIAAGLPRGFYAYALKHNAMTSWLDRGVPIGVIAERVGHVKIDTSASYIRTRDESAPFHAGSDSPGRSPGLARAVLAEAIFEEALLDAMGGGR